MDENNNIALYKQKNSSFNFEIIKQGNLPHLTQFSETWLKVPQKCY